MATFEQRHPGTPPTSTPKKKRKAPKPPPPSRQSGGTSGDLTVKGYKPKTPIVKVRVEPLGQPAKPSSTKPKRSRAPKAILAKLPSSENPQLEHFLARHKGTPPAVKFKRQFPHVTEKAEKGRYKYIAEHEDLGEPEDITHAIEAATMASGVGAVAKVGGEAGVRALGAAFAKEAESKALEKGIGTVEKKAGGEIVAKLKSAPKAALQRTKRYPGKKVRQVKAAPRTAKKAVTTSEGRRDAAKAAARHPVKTGVPAAAALPPGVVEVHGIDPGQRARAFLEGTAAAFTHPGKVAETTGKGVLGIFTGPLAIGGAAVSSAKQGSLAPLEKTGAALVGETAHMISGLASGDPKKVEETTLQETGAIPFIPIPHVVKRLKGTSVYEDGVRGRVRSTVEGHRARTRQSRIDAQRAAQQSGAFITRKQARKVRQPVADTAHPGESYVLRRTGRLIERQRSRHHVSREVARMQEEGTYAGKRESEAVAKPLRKSPGTDNSQQNDSDALAVILKHGLPLDHRTLDWARRLNEHYGSVSHGEIPPGVHLDRHSVQWILDHPEMFQGKRGAALQRSVAEFDRQAEAVGTSTRHRYLAQVLNIINPKRIEEGKHPILLPEEMVQPATLRLLPKRDKPWSRSEALDYAKGARDKKLAKKIERSLDGLMRPPEHGGAKGGVSTTRAVAWTPEQEQAFERQVVPEIKRMGLRKPAAYVANRVPSGMKGEERLPNFGAEVPLRKVWPSRGLAAASGNAESSFESLIHHSIEAPRTRASVVNGLNRVFDRASREIGGKRYLTRSQIERAINRQEVPESTVFIRTQALKSLLEGEHTIDAEGFRRQLEGELEQSQALTSGAQIATEMKTLEGAKGEKFAPMDAAAVSELLGHLQPLGKITKVAAHSTNFVTRLILNSPAFAAIQIPQEGLPLAAALGANVVHVPMAIRNLERISKLPAEDQAAVKAVVGSSVGVLGAPSIRELRATGYMDPARAAGGKSALRHALDVVNGNLIGRFDRGRAGLFRQIAADAKVQGDFRKAAKGFNLWRRGANNLFKNEEAAVKAMKGMDRAERMAYVSAYPKLGDKLMRAMNDMAGNWNSFTVFEKHFAPLTLFYPFQRYSVLWMLYHFPLDHPVVATALSLMGEANARELEAIAAKKGAAPGILDYTMPVIQNGPGKEATVLPAGLRTFPGLATVQQAAVSGKPSQLLGELPPAISIPAEAATGKSSYTGLDIKENGWLYGLRQAANLSPLLRFVGAPNIGEEQSAASKAFEHQDPLHRLRSPVDPFIGQTAGQYAETKKLEKEFGSKYDPNRNVPSAFDMPAVQKLLYGHNGRPNPNKAQAKRELAKVIREIHEGERSSAFIKRKEAPFLPPEKDFTKFQSELLQAVEDAWETGPNGRSKKPNPFGIPSTDSGALREQFGLPATSSADLRKQFGIE